MLVACEFRAFAGGGSATGVANEGVKLLVELLDENVEILREWLGM